MLITTGIKQMEIKAYHLLSTLKSFNAKKSAGKKPSIFPHEWK